MSKLLKNFVGIDISKTYFDMVVIKDTSVDKSVHHQFLQTPAEFVKMRQWLRQQGVHLDDQTLFCMEDTGIYNHGLVNFLATNKAQVWVEMPLRIKRADGFERGGDDKTAALKIAIYAFRYQDRMQLWQALDSKLLKIKNLIAQRDRIVKAMNQLQVPVNELTACGCKEEGKQMRQMQEPAIKQLRTTKQLIENKIKDLVKTDHKISSKVKQVESIKGIGHVTAVALLIYTKGFTSFQNAKQLACYCGVVPFKKDSGTSVRSRPKVSQYANKKLKWLLHMCAMSAIRFDNELKAYYNRKKAEGKNKMSVLNAVRNKLVHRVFAITRDERLFVKDYVRICA
jgi:transposase